MSLTTATTHCAVADADDRLAGLLARSTPCFAWCDARLHAGDTALRVPFWILPTMPAISGCREAGALGQLAHFVGDDGESATLFASARRLDRRIECEQVRLVGDRGWY